MALDTGRTDRTELSRWTAVIVVGRRLLAFARQVVTTVHAYAVPWMQRQPLWKICTKTLGRRVMVANLFGWLVLVGGLAIFNRYYEHIIDVKVDALRTQAQMIAVAIASNAKADTDRIIFEIDRPLETEGARIPFRDDSFAAMQLSLAPERIAPVLRRLVLNSNTRARIYSRERTLLADTGTSAFRDPGRRATPIATDDGDQRLRNFWTRFLAWFLRSELPVYRDLGALAGSMYPEVREAMTTGAITRMLLINSRGDQMVAVAAPIQVAKANQGVVLLTTSPGEIDKLIDKERRALMVISSLALCAALLAALLLERTIVLPMRKLSDSADHVSHSINARRDLPDLSDRRDEIGQMATAFRAMTASLYRRIEASDRFAQDVAHELKNPVAAARSTAESLAYAKSPEQRAELARRMQGELKRLNRLISDVANASRLDAELARQETEPIDLGEIVGGVVTGLGDLNSDSAKTIVLDKEPSGDPTAFVVRGHAGRLAQVMTNLIDNALSFSPEDGVVTVRMRASATTVEIVIDDLGPGMPPDTLEDIFKRFYSDRPQTDSTMGKNSGLGLSISREIIVAHGGTVHAENRKLDANEVVSLHEMAELAARRIPGIGGARFVVRLPVQSARV